MISYYSTKMPVMALTSSMNGEKEPQMENGEEPAVPSETAVEKRTMMTRSGRCVKIKKNVL